MAAGSGGPVLGVEPAGIALWDVDHALIVGSSKTTGGDGVVASSDDGGRTWTVRSSGTAAMGPLATSGSNDAWVVTACSDESCRPVVFHSTDRGMTWSPLPTVAGPQIDSVSFADPQHGWAVTTARGPSHGGGPVPILASDDGGATWQVLGSPCGASFWPVGVALPSLAQGWVACVSEPGAGNQGKAIVSSEDGGRTWKRLAVVDPFNGVDFGGLGVSGYLSGIVARPDGHLWGWEQRGSLIGSADGGRTWHGLPLGNDDVAIPGPASFADDANGVALLADGDAQATIVEGTSDGAGTWRELSRFPYPPS